jgi:iron complex transport system substrate-binding protein
MKRKDKVITILGISVLLCSLFLVTIPVTAIAAEEDDFVLDIYGNANEDDTIDMRDLTYVKLIFFGKKPETELADAKYDGKINPLDFIQIKLIIVGKEKKLTVIDATDRTVTINMPIERIVCSSLVQDVRTIAALGAADKIVGVTETLFKNVDSCVVLKEAYPEVFDLPCTGGGGIYPPNIEVIASLDPDLAFAYTPDVADTIQETTGIPTLCISTSENLDFKWFKCMGYALNEQGRAEELISYLNEKIDEVTEITSSIPDDGKPKVYLAFWTFMGSVITYTPAVYVPVELAGGIKVLEGGTSGPFGPSMLQVSKEQIIGWNPDLILIHRIYSWGKGTAQITIEDVLSDPDLQSVSAVKNEDVYYTKGYLHGWDPATAVCEVFYMAKLFHPEEFGDLDVEEEGNEILKKVYGADGLWTEITEKFELYKWE